MRKDRLDQLLDDYWVVLQNSALSDASVEDYWYFATAFVRWTKGEFVPGQNKVEP